MCRSIIPGNRGKGADRTQQIMGHNTGTGFATTRDGTAGARVKGKLPGRQPLDGDQVSAALKLVAASVSPAEAARQLGTGRPTAYREMGRLGVTRPA